MTRAALRTTAAGFALTALLTGCVAEGEGEGEGGGGVVEDGGQEGGQGGNEGENEGEDGGDY